MISGATRTTKSSETALARQQVVVTAKAFDLQAIYVVYIDYKGIKSRLKENSYWDVIIRFDKTFVCKQYFYLKPKFEVF